MDISVFQQKETVTIPLLSPKTGEPIGATVDIYGTESQQFIEAQQININNRLRNADKAKTPEYDAERTAREEVLIAVAVTKSWAGLTEKGEVLPCDTATCKRLYTSLPSMRAQIIAALNDQTLFFAE